MEVILRKNLDKLGQMGDVIKVKDGFARNFLIPKGLAFNATKANLKVIDAIKNSKVALLERQKVQAQELASKLESASFTLAVEANDEDGLYGSIDSAELASFLEGEGYKIDKKNLLLDEPIKSLGIYYANIKLHPEVDTKIKIWVVRK